METVEKFSFEWGGIPKKAYERIYKNGGGGITEIFKGRIDENLGIFYGDYNGAGIFMGFYFEPKTINSVLCLSGKPTIIRDNFCLTPVLETIDYEEIKSMSMALNGSKEQIISAQEKLDDILETKINDLYPHWRKR